MLPLTQPEPPDVLSMVDSLDVDQLVLDRAVQDLMAPLPTYEDLMVGSCFTITILAALPLLRRASDLALLLVSFCWADRHPLTTFWCVLLRLMPTGWTPSPVLPLYGMVLFLHGALRGRMAGRLPPAASLSGALRQWLVAQTLAGYFWLLQFRATLLTYLTEPFRPDVWAQPLTVPVHWTTTPWYLLGLVLHPFTVALRPTDRHLRRILVPRRFRLWVNLAMLASLTYSSDWLTTTLASSLLAALGYLALGNWHSWALDTRLDDSADVFQLLRMKLSRRGRTQTYQRKFYFYATLCYLLTALPTASAYSSFSDLRTDLLAEICPMVVRKAAAVSAALLTAQALHISATAVEDYTAERHAMKELQHKRNPYRPQRPAIFERPVPAEHTEAGLTASPDVSKDAVPGFVVGKHSACTDDDVVKLGHILHTHEKVFYRPGTPLPSYSGRHPPFSIPWVDETTPEYQPPRNFAAKETDLIKAQNQKMFENDITERAPITCPHASNPILAAKRDPVTREWTDIRFCIDFRPINRRTKKFNYRTMTPEQLFQRIGRAKFITTLDLKNGYHLIELPEDVRDKTAFWVGTELWRFKRMPFGLAGSPAFFQSVMDDIFSDLKDERGNPFTAIYLDDVCVFSDTLEEHLHHIDLALKRLQERLGPGCVHPEKSVFCGESVEYLGYQLTSGGKLTPQQAKILAFKRLPHPTSISELRSALSLFSYYRSFCPLFSQMAEPLNRLLRNGAVAPGQQGFRKAWTAEHARAFDQLRDQLCTPGLQLQTADPDRPYTLYTDWSVRGMGAILAQFDNDGREYIVAAISRSLTTSERRYSPFEGEALAVVWAVATFRPYLYGQRVTIVTDHRPLRHLWKH